MKSQPQSSFVDIRNHSDIRMAKPKIFVGVSGGVDSSVALALLKEQGYDITGVFLKVWSPDWLPCTWRDERRSAMRVCATLGVPFITLDCEQEYKDKIVDYMIAEYKAGRTPNPDVFCNKYIKFGIFLSKAIEAGADYVATGHYARVEERSTNNELRMEQFESDPFVHRTSYIVLRESADREKDQSYFLHQLGQFELSRTLFPIGHLQKSEVRKLAQKFGLPTAEKKDSQGLCFIGKVDMKEFLSHYIQAQPGDVLDEAGKVIGRHDGAVFYTIGERHGFEIFTHGESDPRLFVVTKDMLGNTITVGSRIKNDELRITNESDLNPLIRTSYIVHRHSMNWVSGHQPDLSNSFDVRFRYRQEKQKCRIVARMVLAKEMEYEIIPEKPQFGIAPGQLAVIYQGSICLGGGVIV